MGKLLERRAHVRHVSRVLSAGSAVEERNFEQGRPRQSVEIEPGVELVRASEPSGPEGDFVLFAVDHSCPASQGRLHVVVHVLGGAGRDQVEDRVRRIVGVLDHLATAVVSQEAPVIRAAVEAAVLNQLLGSGRRSLHHAHVVHQGFSSIEEPEVELVPAGGADIGRGDPAVLVRPPRGLPGLSARRPSFGRGVVRPRVRELEA